MVRIRTDAALLGFVERQTGLSHTRFLVGAHYASRAIDALKAWLGREAGVVWPAKDHDDGLASRRAIVEAQWRRLVE